MEVNSSDWSRSEVERIVAWLEDPTNLRRTIKGSGETKKRWIMAMAATIPFRSDSQVGYKLDNLKKSYRQAVGLASQSGWGLGEGDLTNMNVVSLQEKLERKCPFFSRLDAIWGNRPNIRPPTHFSSGSTSEETAKAATNLIHALEATPDTRGREGVEPKVGEIENMNNEIQDHGTRSPSSSNDREIQEIIIQDNAPPKSPTSSPSQQARIVPQAESPATPPRACIANSLPSHGRKEKRKQEFTIIDEEDDKRKYGKKKAAASLGDAISVMAEKKYIYLEKQLEQQGNIRKEELELEKKKIEIRERELELEKSRWDMILDRVLRLPAMGNEEGSGGGRNTMEEG